MVHSCEKCLLAIFFLKSELGMDFNLRTRVALGCMITVTLAVDRLGLCDCLTVTVQKFSFTYLSVAFCTMSYIGNRNFLKGKLIADMSGLNLRKQLARKYFLDYFLYQENTLYKQHLYEDQIFISYRLSVYIDPCQMLY